MAQIWPTSDDFSGAGTDYTYPNRYHRFYPLAGSTGYPAPAGLSIGNEVGDLISWSTSTGSGAAAIGRATGASTAASFYCRTAKFVDGEVTANFERVDLVGPPSDSRLSRLAVYGRVNTSGFPLSSVSGEYLDEYMDRPDCIEFAVVDSGSGSPSDTSFVVGYYTAGVYTSLGAIQISSWSAATLGVSPGMGYYEISRLRMVMSGTSIKCYAKPKASFGTSTTSPVRTVNGEIEVFDVSAPSSSGYAGFGIPTWWETATWNGSHLVDSFQIKTGGAVTFRDEFARFSRFGRSIPLYSPVLIAGHALSAKSVASAYSGDGDSNTSIIEADFLAYPMPYGGLMHGVSGEIRIGRSIPATFSDPDMQKGNYGFMFDAVDYGVIPQRRQLDFEFNASGASCGIMLRAYCPWTQSETRLRDDPTTLDDVGWNPPSFSTGLITPGRKEGYLCMITYDTGASPVWLMRVLRFDLGVPDFEKQFPEVIATADLSIFSLLPATTVELDFEVRNFNALPDGSGGNLAMRASIGGVDVDLVAEELPGVSFQDGWLYDLAAPNALYSHTGSAMFAETYLPWGSAVANHVVIKKWQHLTLSSPPATSEPDQPSVALEAEDYGKTGTFDFPIDWSVKEDRNRAMREMETTAQYRYKSPIGSRLRRSWSLQSSGITDDERDAIIEFIKDHNGPEIPFDWYRADTGDTIAVRYMTNSFSYQKDTLNSNSCGLSFEEVFSELEYNAQI